ncbi:MAG: deoxyribose-phosphate aldolase [Firmicutes bacterium]|nr:deoxyribose-phosphate aldolase [Bacillota bacterium]
MSQLAQKIDHTLLKPTATNQQIRNLCVEAKEYNFKSVCINPCYVAEAAACLAGTDVAVCTVIGFPLGAATTTTKCLEALEAVQSGAAEVDMVINIGAAKAGNWEYVKQDIAAVVNKVKDQALVKVIIETCLLTAEEKKQACLAAVAACADFVKTSTGFSTGGATVEDVRLMRQAVGDKIKIKASGGINSYESALAMLAAGADRLGTSAGLAIVRTAN